MRQSQLFTKTRREAPTDEIAQNAQLPIRAGYLHKEMAGVYSYLPLGLRVMKKIEGIIREEMDAIGGIEMKTAVFQSKSVWEKSNRWSDDVVDTWFKTKLKNGSEIGLSFTNEEAYSNILKQYVSSFRDPPAYPYDFKEIFRNEARSKSGITRSREFYWKALYSFSKNEEEHNVFYEKAKEAYGNIFRRVGIGDLTYITLASGGTFSKFSHEFQTLTGVGEDTIFVDKKTKVAVNQEVYTDEVLKSFNLNKEELQEKKAVEVGNIFTLGTKFSEPFDLKYKNENGEENMVYMGSYGIGLGRLMGTVVEVLSDEKGIIWPKSIAPFQVHLLSLTEKTRDAAAEVYQKPVSNGIETLFDDRDLRAGEKFADSDLIGIPTRIVIGENASGAGKFEVKNRATGEVREVTLEHLIEELR